MARQNSGLHSLAKAAILAQLEDLKMQKQELAKVASEKERNAGGLLAAIGNAWVNKSSGKKLAVKNVFG